MKLAPLQTVVCAAISVNLEAGRREGVGRADRKVTCDRDGLGQV